MLGLLALVLPLSLDTFAIAAAIGMAGLPASRRLRLSLVLTAFEAGMPLVGVGLGHALGHAVGAVGDPLAGSALIALGASMALGDGRDESRGAARVARARGLVLIGLGITISLDELAIGFGIGLLDLPVAWAIVLIACQAFAAAQLGLRLGAGIGERLRTGAEVMAALALIGIGAIVLAASLG